jgi:DNA-directed RNA polymerase specialized sigma24 family protein
VDEVPLARGHRPGDGLDPRRPRGDDRRLDRDAPDGARKRHASDEGLPTWVKLSNDETVYSEDVGPIARQLRLQSICGDAVGRLARRQEQVVTDSYWGEQTPGQIAADRRIARQTVYSTRGQAERNWAAI